MFFFCVYLKFVNFVLFYRIATCKFEKFLFAYKYFLVTFYLHVQYPLFPILTLISKWEGGAILHLSSGILDQSLNSSFPTQVWWGKKTKVFSLSPFYSGDVTKFSQKILQIEKLRILPNFTKT